MLIKTNIPKGQSGGYILLTAVIFFLIAGSAITFGVASSAIYESRLTRNIEKAKISYYAAEAGLEDVVYRLKNGISVSNTENLAVGSNGVVTTITDVSGGKLIQSEGAALGDLRRVQSKLIIGTGVAFNYGVQSGTGGFQLEENAIVNGNVHASGPIIGKNGSKITGSAVSASGSALSADQVNDTPSTPVNSIKFRDSSSNQDFAQSFVLATAGPVSKVEFYIKKESNPSNATVRVMTDNSGVPGSELASGDLVASLVASSYGWVSVSLSSNPQLAIGTTYWVVIDNGSNHSSKYYTIGANSSYTNGQAKIGKLGGTWNDTSPSGLDGYFKVYLDGLVGLISGVTVGTGTEGDAWANTVNNSTILGSLYCQSGSGNNKACDTSKSDPTPQDFPVSDGNIAEWKAQAEAGGIITGDYTLGSSESLGPKKITGNLTVQGSKTLTVTGTLWVVGNILVDNGAKIELSPDYGTDSGVIVTDGTVTTTNNSFLNGSGQTGSYLMLLTESSSLSAIKLDNNVQSGILYARNGRIELENNAKAKGLAADTIKLENNATIDYEVGLINPTFSSGPSGGFNFIDWKEVE